MKFRLPLRQRRAIEEYLEALVTSVPDRLEAVILFGSQARGTAGPNSDTDLALILSGKKTTALRWAVAEASFSPIAKYGAGLSSILIPASSFKENTPLNRRIKKEGIVLWDKKRKNLLAAA